VFVVHIDIRMKAGQARAAEKFFHDPFRPAISAQEGFQNVQLLRSEDGGDYVLTIAFSNQALQQKWVATDLHQQVWPQMETFFERYTLKTYAAV
jgi:heme-degrading monooxygenase HmoA